MLQVVQESFDEELLYFPLITCSLKKVGQKQCFGRNLKALGLCPVRKSGRAGCKKT